MKKKKSPVYQLVICGEIRETYHDRDWACHSAECYAGYFGRTVQIVERDTGEVVYTAGPQQPAEIVIDDGCAGGYVPAQELRQRDIPDDWEIGE